MPFVPLQVSPDDFAADPRLAPFANVRDRDLARDDGAFVAEGEVVLRVLVDSPYRVRALLLAEGRDATLAPLLGPYFARNPDVPAYVVRQAVMDAVVGFPIHRGILAVAERPVLASADECLARHCAGEPTLALGLVGIANHDNVGGIFRNAAAFGVRAALLDGATCDPLYRKALRVSVGGVLRVPYARSEDGEGVVRAFESRGFEVISLSPSGSHELEDLPPHPRRALLLGAEGPGLPERILATTRAVRIPMADGFDSLNVATTSGIALHALRSRRRAVQ
ncbi:MAG: RNA methyltransferase [Polyangiaceae bacterium]